MDADSWPPKARRASQGGHISARGSLCNHRCVGNPTLVDVVGRVVSESRKPESASFSDPDVAQFAADDLPRQLERARQVVDRYRDKIRALEQADEEAPPAS